MNTTDAILARRSIRKFSPEPVSRELLTQLVEITRLYPTGGNLQPLRFAIVTNPRLTDAIFPDLKWAMYLPGYTIGETERPTAYVVLLRDSRISKKCDYDVGAASALLMVAAADRGIGSCPIGNFTAAKVSALLGLEEDLHPELVIAMGYPAQESRPVPMEDTIRYRQDEAGNFLVPKWNTEDILLFAD